MHHDDRERPGRTPDLPAPPGGPARRMPIDRQSEGTRIHDEQANRVRSRRPPGSPTDRQAARRAVERETQRRTGGMATTRGRGPRPGPTAARTSERRRSRVGRRGSGPSLDPLRSRSGDEARPTGAEPANEQRRRGQPGTRKDRDGDGAETQERRQPADDEEARRRPALDREYGDARRSPADPDGGTPWSGGAGSAGGPDPESGRACSTFGQRILRADGGYRLLGPRPMCASGRRALPDGCTYGPARCR